MGIVGIGVDVVSISRIAALVQRRSYNRLAKRILSRGELHQWRTIPQRDDARRIRFLAVRWSIKESAYKAFYPIRPMWQDFTYTSFNPADGLKPMLAYHSAFNPSTYSFHASVSHDGDYVFTSVIIEETR